jgi:recombination protein RecA
VSATASFFPPDVDDGGVDLRALVVVRAPDPQIAARAADQIARSSAFGLVVLDLGAHGGLPTALLARLLGLAQKHDVAIMMLTERSTRTPSLGSLISLRLNARRVRRGNDYACELVAVKDKRRAPGWTHQELCCGPAGLC